MVLTLRLSVLYGLVPCTTLTDRFCITEVKCLLRGTTESLYKMDKFGVNRVKYINGNAALKNLTVRVGKQISEWPNPERVRGSSVATQQVQRTSPVRTDWQSD